MTAKRSAIVGAALVIALGLLGGFVSRVGPVAVRPAGVSASATPVLPPAAQGAPTGGALDAVESALEQVYTRVSPSVVAIRVVQRQAVTMPPIPEIPGSPFFTPPQGGPRYLYRQALGSGFVWDAQGHIVTNNHVVAGADRISVAFSDGTTVPARVVGADPDSDLAVLTVDLPQQRITPVQVGDSTQVKVGQIVIAIGNPFGEENTMTMGIVSAVGRSLPAGERAAQGPVYTIPDVIQTDAPINPGNSGGVLVDDHSRVIGVTAAIESPVQASAGIGFAIPAAIVQRVVPALIQTGHYAHPWLGVSGLTLTPDLSRAMGLKLDQHGALVVDVSPGSPADRAHLSGSDRTITIDGADVRVGGDVIVALDGRPIRGFDDLVAYLVRSTAVGQQMTLTVLRQGREQTVTVMLAARPQRPEP